MATKIFTAYSKQTADLETPVGIYLKIRDRFTDPILLESSDYHTAENSFSFICFDPLARFEVKSGQAHYTLPNGSEKSIEVNKKGEAMSALSNFMSKFEVEDLNMKFPYQGLFGYTGYQAVRYFEDISLEKINVNIPDMAYRMYRYVIAINHFNNELYIFSHHTDQALAEDGLTNLKSLIKNRNIAEFDFHLSDKEHSIYSDEEFLEILQKGKDHCQRGDVFQIVLSRKFSQAFKGDEFQVYRSLRSINPSPYLFYFDFGNFKIFGSSPEAQLIVQEGRAEIHPIAGTFKRTGNDEKDQEIAKQLYNDPKENSEHVMLVDLARNDMSRHGKKVKVEKYKEIQYFSHVIHLVSKVTARLSKPEDFIRVVEDTFPAGTLSGAPKHNAMKLIDQYEKVGRGYYGGAIGIIDFKGNFNHAITIRSFLSMENTLHYQAGAGVVAQSDINSELQEVDNKLAALRKAIEKAQEILR
ncbi:MAG: anthranilate synthase component I family protein [Cyclobacteriaceae bacterium]|nr:anthranilate synthase component I family protein [Cyclobacteriaceae bacterium]MCH8516969.1 anthranilate synthase component I family protein [Cyclobacteriaceae bacterium]